MADAVSEQDEGGGAPAIGTVLEGRYELTARLGEGGVGWVYRAKHVRLGTEVAIKMLQAPYDHHESLRPRFEREAQALAQLRHPNIVTMTDYSVADGRPYLVMERLEGCTLAELVEEGPIPEARARRILRQTLDALIYAHGRGFAHRDLKPSNIFLVELPTDPDHVKILDFGFVKLMRDVDRKRPALTVSGIAFGTPSYMCPEQATGGPTDPRADLYSAGIVLFEVLSGRRPFVGEIPEVIRAHLTEPVPRLVVGAVEAGRDLRAFLERALAKSPADRFQSAAEMREALDALPVPALVSQADARALEHAETVPPPAPVGPPRSVEVAERAGSRPRSRRVGLGIAIGLLAIGGAAAAVLALPAGDPAREGREEGGAAALEVPTASTADSVEAPRPRAPVVRADDLAPGELPDDEVASSTEGVEALVANEQIAPTGDGIEPGAVDPGGIEPGAIDPGPVDPNAIDPNAVEPNAVEPNAAAVEPAVEEVASAAEVRASGGTVEPVAAEALADPWSVREPVPLLEAARRTLSRGRPLSPSGERTLREYVREHRSDPRPHLLLAQHYLERGVDRGSLERYALAERVDPSARQDTRMLADLVRLASRAAVSEEAGDLIVRLYAREAAAEVARALAEDRLDAASRARLETLRARLGSVALSP